MSKSKKPFHGYNKEKHSRTGGLNEKYREKYNRETGSNLKAPVTQSNPKGKDKARKDSFCARMSGVKGPTSKDGKLTPKGAALKRWKCSKSQADIDAVFNENWEKQTPKKAQDFFSGKKEGEKMKKPSLIKSEMPSLIQYSNNEIQQSFLEKSYADDMSRKGSAISSREILDIQLSNHEANLYKTGSWCGPEKKKKATKKSIGPINEELKEDYSDQKRLTEDTHAESMHSDVHQDVIDALNDICAADFHHAGVHNLENSDRRKPMKVPSLKFYFDPVKSDQDEADLLKAKKKKNRCWEGYEPVPGKKPFSPNSCVKKGKTAVGKKISKLVRDEGMPQKQAVATALEMERRGRLTSEGEYQRVKKKSEDIELDIEKSFDQDELFLNSIVEKLESSQEIEKAKYTKRTGAPGNYKYFYGDEGSKRKTGKKIDSMPVKDDDKFDFIAMLLAAPEGKPKEKTREEIQKIKENQAFERAVKDFKNLKDDNIDGQGSKALEGKVDLSNEAKAFIDKLAGRNGISMKLMSGNRLIIFTDKFESLFDRTAKEAGLDPSKISLIGETKEEFDEARVLTIPLDAKGPSKPKIASESVLDDLVKALIR